MCLGSCSLRKGHRESLPLRVELISNVPSGRFGLVWVRGKPFFLSASPGVLQHKQHQYHFKGPHTHFVIWGALGGAKSLGFYQLLRRRRGCQVGSLLEESQLEREMGHMVTRFSEGKVSTYVNGISPCFYH